MRHLIPRFLCLFLALAALPPVSLHAETLRDQMTEEQFARAGLDKLSDDELTYLSDWLAGKVDEEKEKVVNEIIPAGENRFGADEQIQRNVDRIRPEPKELVSRIAGPFDGWDGDTVFYLENGQVWKQTQRDKFAVRLEDPIVTIEKGILGAYFLSVEGFGSRVKVKRLR